MAHRIRHTRTRGRGQVLIEFALAAVGILVIAFVTARVASWLNRTMVDRNRSFQASRLAAGQSKTLVPFFGNSEFQPIHLIGPKAESTGGAPQVAAKTYSVSCPAGVLRQTAADRARQAAADCMRDGTTARNEVERLENEAEDLVRKADELERIDQRIADATADLAACEASTAKPPPDCDPIRRRLARAIRDRDNLCRSLPADVACSTGSIMAGASRRANDARGETDTAEEKARCVHEKIVEAEDNEQEGFIACSQGPAGS